MNTEDSVRIVEEFFAATDRSDVQGLSALCAGDVEWVIPGEWAWAGTHRGHAGLLEFLQRAPRTVEISTSERHEFVAQGDRVVVFGVATGIIRGTGKTFEDQFVFSFTIRDGKVSRVREYIDTLALAVASNRASKVPS